MPTFSELIEEVNTRTSGSGDSHIEEHIEQQTRPDGFVEQHHCMVCHQTWINENQVHEIPQHPDCMGRNMSTCTNECGDYFRNNNPLNDSLRHFNLPPNAFEDVMFNLDFGYSPNTTKPKAKKFIPKTMGEEYELVLPKLVGLKTKEEIDKVLRDYVELRDEQLLRKILDDSHDAHTAYELRCFIKDYIFKNK